MPISEKQMKVLAFPYSRYDAIICDGAIRSGKTSVMMVAFVDWLMREFDRQNFIVLGNTVSAATSNVIEPYTAMSYAHERYNIEFNRSRGVLIIKAGGRENYVHIFGAKNARSYEVIQGLTAAGCFVDEVAICDRKAVETATARCSVDGSRLWFNCNPSYPTHWFREQWILGAAQKNAMYLHFTMDDNPSLSERIRERYESMYSGVFYERYILGRWVVAEGLVYQFNSPDGYTCPAEEATGNGYGDWYISIDYGITNPFAALLWRVTPECAYVVDEYYFDSRREGYRKTDAEHLACVLELAGDLPITDVVIDPSANSFKEAINRIGRFDWLNADNNVLEGIAVTDQLLHDGTVKISEKCANTIVEMGMYRWDDKAGRDAVIKEFDHAMDALRYLCSTVLRDLYL